MELLETNNSMNKVKRNGLFVAVPKTKVFALPEGKFKCKVHDLFEMPPHRVKNDRSIRCLFEVDVPGMENCQCMAGREFVPDLSPGGEFRSFFSRVVSSSFFDECEGGQVDLEELIGVEGMIELRHYEDGEHEKPFVLVWDLRPLPRAEIKMAA